MQIHIFENMIKKKKKERKTSIENYRILSAAYRTTCILYNFIETELQEPSKPNVKQTTRRVLLYRKITTMSVTFAVFYHPIYDSN